MKSSKSIPLPAPVIESDLKRPADYKLLARETEPRFTHFGGAIEFELWYTDRFGWCIPTLTIRALSGRMRERGAETRRTYAVSVKDGQLVSMGLGPHVLATRRVYVKASRLSALTPLLETMLTGTAKAGECRDRISTRRANTMLRRGGIPSWL